MKSKINQIRTYNFAISTVKFIRTLPSTSSYWNIADQLGRSSSSISANIFEAKAAHSRRDFLKFYEIALKSAHETKHWFNLLKESSDIKNDELLVEIDEIIKMLSSSVLSLKRKL